MTKKDSAVNQHKRMAMGDASVAKDNNQTPLKLKTGGAVGCGCGSTMKKGKK